MPRNKSDGQASEGRLSPFLEQQRIHQAVRFIPPNADILDIGCGRARILEHLPSVHTYVGLDLLEDVVLENRRHYPNHRFFCVDIERDQVPAEGKFDVIIMLAILEHLRDTTRTLSKLSEFLGDNGRIILTTPHPVAQLPHQFGARIGLFSRAAAEEHTRFFNRAMLADLVRGTGLSLSVYRRFQVGLNQIAVCERAL